MLLNLIRAEWFKLARRPLVWALLSMFVGSLALLRTVEFLAVALSQGTFSGGQIRLSLLRPEQIELFRRQLSFPGIFGAALGHVNGTGGFFAIVLAAGAMGSEYGWGTLRTQLARQPNRRRYLLAKLAVLELLQLAAALIALALGSALALIYGPVLGMPGAVGWTDLLALPLGVLRALYVLLPYVLVTVASSIMFRTALAGIIGGFLFLFLDVSLGALALLANLSPLFRTVVNLVVQPNINSLIMLNSRDFGLDPAVATPALDLAALPSPLQATLVIGAYSAIFFAYAYLSLTRRDIGGGQ